MRKALLLFGLIISLGAVGVGQIHTVTNTTLQKFQEKRLAGEREYRNNYARLGFPSPEELERQRADDMEDRLILAQQLRQERLEKERLDIERTKVELEFIAAERAAERAAEAEQARYYGAPIYGGYGYGGYGTYEGYGRGRYEGYYPDPRYGRRYGRYGGRYGSGLYLPLPGGYRATGVGIYPSSGLPVPIIRRRR